MWNIAKMDRRRALPWGLVLLLVVFVLVLTAAYLYERSWNPAGVTGEDREGVALYVEALREVEGDYVNQEAINPKEQAYGAIKGMLQSVDKEGHTRFLPPGEVEKNRQNYASTYIGVGVKLENKDEEVVVTAPMDDSPAEEAGIEPGDVIIAVDGESVQGENIVEVTEKLEGAEGSRLDLTVLRNGETKEFSMERVELEVPAASWNLIPGTDVAHLRLASFSDNSAAEVEGAIAEAREAGARRFVLDLRNNAGGWVDQAEEVAAQFLPAGSSIYIQKGAHGDEEETTVPEDNEPLDAPVVVLVNKGSASSAEIVAGALRDNDRAELVGGTTFGAGTVLEERPLSDGSAILLATAEWLTPDRDSIQRSGIEPDDKAGLDKGQEPRTPDEVRGLSREEIFAEDAQLERAVEILQEG